VGGVAASAVAFALYARVDWPWLVLGWVGLVPWLVVLERVTTLRGALALGWLMCEAFVLAVFAWLPSAIANYTGASWFVALGVVVLVAPLLQPQFLLFALARQLARRYAIAAANQGAEVIVTLSNDSWFTFGNVPRLILMISAFPSIETRRPQVRATNTGISAIITPTGEFLGTIAVHERASLVAAVPLEHGATTLMLAWGDWFAPTCPGCGCRVAHELAAAPRRAATAAGD